ncbi:MBL fold metallo-hydrolase [Clostridium sp. HCS.1]|uniref:MBL fold metallo-hydrolase n=1 Tax=Clostridium sp. HCS.1 TaxID=3238594 RepID=UPI003A1018DC
MKKMKLGKIALRILEVILIVTIIITLFVYINPVFGGRISKEDKSNYEKRAENYVNGRFIYPSEYEIKNEFTDNPVSKKEKLPKGVLPSANPSISQTSKEKFAVAWFGHSSLLIQMNGMNILIDHMFSERSSPISFMGPKRFSEPPITIEELPEIDIVIISHDHYDHLDMNSIKELDDKVDKYIVPLGVNKHLERWNIDESKIQDMAWWEEVEVNGLTIACTPARHFSNRKGFNINRTLYASWVLKNENYQVYESGDGGFGGHFKEIHEKYGDFDLAIMENGQYNMKWHNSHMFPEEAAEATRILGAKKTMPIHWGAFVLSDHGWDDPIERFLTVSEKLGIDAVTPKIGETVYLDKYMNYQEKWWKDIE